MKEKSELVLRLASLLTGLFLIALGLVLCIRARLGITPISCPPYVLSLGLPFTIGQITIVMHLLLVWGQYLLLRSEFRRVDVLQVVLALVFGCFIDGCMWLTAWICPAAYVVRVAVLLLGNVLLALGVHFEMRARFLMLPTDGFVQALTRRTRFSFSRLKIAFDVSLVLISIVCSLPLLGCIEGVREGTLLSAFLVGYLVGVIRRIAG